MKLALAGGGSEVDSASLDRHFARWLGPKSTLLYFPVALGWETASYDRAERWIRSVFKPLGIDVIQTWTDLASHNASELEDFDGLYIGGGNAYRLLAELRSTAFFETIRRYAANGHPIYGGSAGAVVLGRTIATVSHLDVNEYGIGDYTGLNLAGGYSVWVHYREAHRPLIQGFLSEHRERLIVLAERAGLAIEDGDLQSVGPDPAYLVDDNRWEALG